jgi:hypothetical protein
MSLAATLSLSLMQTNEQTIVLSARKTILLHLLFYFIMHALFYFLDTITHIEDFSCDLIVKFKQIKKLVFDRRNVKATLTS